MMEHKKKLPSIGIWQAERGLESDILFSSRLRLARNLIGWKYPYFTSSSERQGVIKQVGAALEQSELFAGCQAVDLNICSETEREMLAEAGFITREMVEGDNRGFYYSEADYYSLMVNEEDHVRVQIVHSGLSLKEAYDQINRIDDELSHYLNYAFSRDWGYLTACPTNVGTGLRASVMIHLPALVYANKIKKILKALGQLGLAVRGFLGEGSENLGDFYQVSNQVTLGTTEEDIINNMHEVTKQLLVHERKTREDIFASSSAKVRDMAQRSLGTLKYSYLISFNEMMVHLSNIFLGISLGILRNLRFSEVKRLMVLQQAAHIKLSAPQKPTGDEAADDVKRDELRAAALRDFFAKGDIA
jgi:protein arginine kinase